MDEIIQKLYEIGAIKFGSFTLKSGIQSPIYIDLRETISYPSLLQAIGEAMWRLAAPLSFDRIVGVPYTALPIASYLSIRYEIPMLMKRKEAKDYGTKKIIEGAYSKGETCLILDDLITSGISIFETITPLEAAELHVKDVIVFLDREQGGGENLTKKGYHLHSITTLRQALESLQSKGHITPSLKTSILVWAEHG